MNLFKNFMQKEMLSGVLLIFATIMALIISNSALFPFYEALLHTPIQIRIGALDIDKHLSHWVNDGLMVLFFLLIGLEVKREVLQDHLSTWSQAALPIYAAIGGIVVPALIYVFFNYGDAEAMRGWAIPTATDIAFALTILSLLGKRVPASLKVFLLALAIIDDIAAILIIALFYTDQLALEPLALASVCMFALILANRFKVSHKSIYFAIGVVLWVCVLKSGIHATLAGVALAMTIPLRGVNEPKSKPCMLSEVEYGLHNWVALLIIPIFAFVNAGINLQGMSVTSLFSNAPMGILLGLFVGKQVGVFGFAFVAIKTGIARMPRSASWLQLYGVSVLTGIGFTMSLFITLLAFSNSSELEADKLAILVASLLSTLLGYALLFFCTAKTHQPLMVCAGKTATLLRETLIKSANAHHPVRLRLPPLQRRGIVQIRSQNCVDKSLK